MASLDVPVIDLTTWLGRKSDSDTDVVGLAKTVADCLRTTGVLIVRDPRVSEADNNRFVDMFENYYEQPYDVKMKDVRPHLHYQVGATPEFTEEARCNHDPECQKMIDDQPVEHRAHKSEGPDPKWRFFWRVGPRPEKTAFKELNAECVLPAAFPEWQNVCDMWGSKMLGAIDEVAQLAALGLDLPRDTFKEMLNCGPHLLAPTGSDLGRFGKKDTVFAGFHTDLNFMTIHGKSRFPGLYIWLRDGRKISLAIPDGCLLVQAGMQLEYATGGAILAGWHEVVVSERTIQAVEAAKAAGRSVWRVSSTLFSHVASDVTLQPLQHFATPEANEKYPPIATGEFVTKELNRIKLAAPSFG
eukprot:TRINITY_DN13377_c0_g1_i1.p1 TRINITY_DN13377_c0_g1~~TRINITY_DN13377_c0_g1_i1.p1  ORF type:complete len:357 (-),score=74.92 TRINITY_DN13377_c0_g1_i1:40-1110(-)